MVAQWLKKKKNPPANAGDSGSTLGWEEEMAIHSTIPAWEIPWAEELCGL